MIQESEGVAADPKQPEKELTSSSNSFNETPEVGLDIQVKKELIYNQQHEDKQVEDNQYDQGELISNVKVIRRENLVNSLFDQVTAEELNTVLQLAKEETETKISVSDCAKEERLIENQKLDKFSEAANSAHVEPETSEVSHGPLQVKQEFIIDLEDEDKQPEDNQYDQRELILDIKEIKEGKLSLFDEVTAEELNTGLQVAVENIRTNISVSDCSEEKRLRKDQKSDDFSKAANKKIEQPNICQEPSAVHLKSENDGKISKTDLNSLCVQPDKELVNKSQMEIPSNSQKFQEVENEDKSTEVENFDLLQLQQAKQINDQQGEGVGELRCYLELPRPATEVTDNSDDQIEQNDAVYNAQIDLYSQLITDDFEYVIDIACYDPEFSTGDSNVETELTSSDIAGEKERPENMIVELTGETKLSEFKKIQILRYLKMQIVHNKIMPNRLPPIMWKFFKEFTRVQRLIFLRIIKEKLEKCNWKPRILKKKSSKSKNASLESVSSAVGNENTFIPSMIEIWGSAIEGNAGESTINHQSPAENSNKTRHEKAFTFIDKSTFMESVEKVVDQRKIDINNLPTWIWDAINQLKCNEKFKFIKYLKRKFGKTLHSTMLSFQFQTRKVPENKKRKKKFKTQKKLPSHFTGKNPQMRWSKEKNTTNVVPFSKVSSGVSSNFTGHRYFEISDPEKLASERISYVNYTEPYSKSPLLKKSVEKSKSVKKSTFHFTDLSFIPFNNNFQTSFNKESTLGRPSDHISCADKRKEANQSYSYSHSSYKNVKSRSPVYPDRVVDFQARKNESPTKERKKNPYGYRYPEDIQRQQVSVQAVNVYDDTRTTKYRGNFKRKFDEMETSFKGSSSNQAENFNAAKNSYMQRTSTEVPSVSGSKKIFYNSEQPKRFKAGSSNQSGKGSDDSKKVVIVDDGNPRGIISEEQAAVLSTKLVQILDHISPFQMHIPRFYTSGLMQGVFRITCADQQSLDWLQQTVTRLPQLWRGAKLHVMPLSEYSPPHVKVSIFIPNLTDNQSVVLKRLERQNPGLNTKSWRVFRQTGNVKGQVLFLEIDKPSLEVLKEMNFKAFLGLSCITFQVPDYNLKETKGKKR